MLHRILEEGYLISQIMVLAKNEFRSTMINPIVFVSIGLLVLISIVSAYGYTQNLLNNIQAQQDTVSLLSLFMSNIGGNSYVISLLFTILAVCLGVFSIAEERYGGVLNVLISKPLYRRDIIIGKFIGLSEFLLLAISLVLVLRVSVALILFPMPIESLIEIFARTIFLIVSQFLFCMAMLGFSMIVGALFRNILLVITITATALYLQWHASVLTLLGPLQILDPGFLYFYSLGIGDNTIFMASSPYVVWLLSVFPYILLLAFETILVLLIDCALFNRYEA